MECTLSKSTSIQASHTNRRKVAEQVVIETLEGRNVEVGDFINGTSFIRSRTSKWENNFEDHRSKFERKAHVWAFERRISM